MPRIYKPPVGPSANKAETPTYDTKAPAPLKEPKKISEKKDGGDS